MAPQPATQAELARCTPRLSGPLGMLALSLVFGAFGAAASGVGENGGWQIRVGLLRPIRDVIFSADGHRIVAGDRRVARVIDVRRCEEICRLDGEPAKLLCLGPDGQSVVGSDSEQRLSQWSLKTGRIATRSQRTRQLVEQARYDPATRTYLLLRADGVLVQARSIGTHETEPRIIARGLIAFALHPRKPCVAAATRSGEIALLDLIGRRLLWSHRLPHRESPFLVRPVFLDGGRLLALCVTSGEGEVLVSHSGRVEAELTFRLRSELAFNQPAADADGGVMLLGATLLRRPHWRPVPVQLEATEDRALSFAVSPDGRLLAAWDEGAGCSLRLFQLPSGRGMGSTPSVGRSVGRVWLEKDRAYIPTHRDLQGIPSGIHIWTLTTGRPFPQARWTREWDPTRRPLRVVTLFVRPGGNEAVAFDVDGSVYWSDRPTSPDSWRELRLPEGAIESPTRRDRSRTHVGFGQPLALAVQIEGCAITAVGGRPPAPRILSDDPRDELLGVSGESVILLRHQETSPDELRVVPYSGAGKARAIPLTGSMAGAVLIANTSRVATVDMAGRLRLWDFAAGKAEALPLPSRDVVELQASPDGAILAATSRGGGTLLWDLREHRVTGRLGDGRGLALGESGLMALPRHDGSLEWSRIRGGAVHPIGWLWILAGDDWAFIARSGDYDSSRNGYLRQLVWRTQGGSFRAVETQRARFRPGLLGRLIRGN